MNDAAAAGDGVGDLRSGRRADRRLHRPGLVDPRPRQSVNLAAVKTYTLNGPRGMTATVIEQGGAITSLLAPDREGRLANVVLGFPDPADYETNNVFFGALIGRFGNRIARGELPDRRRRPPAGGQQRPPSLHGGVGFHARRWEIGDARPNALTLRRTSPDGEDGFPGTLQFQVTTRSPTRGRCASTMPRPPISPTVCNLTQHSYFNLAGGGDILGHRLRLASSRYLPIDETVIPTGELAPVKGTPFDFTAPDRDRRADRRRPRADPTGRRLRPLLRRRRLGRRLCATSRVLEEPRSARRMTMRTTEPGLQFYSGNHINGAGGHGKHTGLCLEAQHFPDAPNRPEFPSTRLAPGETYRQTTEYVFSAG